MKISIFGGGFGLYGYLPALLACGCEVMLPERYRERAHGREDIRALAARVEWSDDDDDALRRCDGAVIALPPVQQRIWVERCLAHDTVHSLFLEKPLDVSPALADRLLDRLEGSGRTFAIGYHFRFTPWGKALLQDNRGAERIAWRFRAHHYEREVSTWKRRPTEGGGALRYYGIHLVALLAELGYESIAASSVHSNRGDEAEAWHATLTGGGLPPCRIEVDSDSESTEFSAHNGATVAAALRDPFDGGAGGQVTDRRIQILIDALREAIDAPRRLDGLYRKVNRLWAAIEAANAAVDET